MALIPHNCPCVGDQGLSILRQFRSNTTARSVILILLCNRNLDDLSQHRLYTQENFYRCRSILAHVYLLVDSYMSNNKFD